MRLNTYNVQGEAAILQRLLDELPAVVLEEEFGGDDWNVIVPDDHVDALVTWCEDHDVNASLV